MSDKAFEALVRKMARDKGVAKAREYVIGAYGEKSTETKRALAILNEEGASQLPEKRRQMQRKEAQAARRRKPRESRPRVPPPPTGDY